MGEAASIIKAFSCQSCARYVCNVMHVKSNCCHDACVFSYDTELVEVSDSESNYELESQCCTYKESH